MKFLIRLTAVAILLAPAVAAPVPDLFPTGVDSGGALLSAGSIDPHYTLIASADSGFPGPDARVVHDAHPIGAWMEHGPVSKWIAPRETASNSGGAYTYRTSFDLTGLEPDSAVITGQWAIDNSAVDIKINGVSIGGSLNGNFASFSSFTIDSGFVEGANTLDFTINNSSNGSTGIRIELSGTADPEAPPMTPPSITAQPDTVSVAIGGSAAFHVSASGAPTLSYQWRKDGIPINAANTSSYAIASVAGTDVGSYDVVITNAWGSAMSSVAFLEVSLALATDEQREREPIGPSRRRSGLAFSEIHYHPLEDGFEFVELYNSNPWVESIAGYQLDGSVEFTFPEGAEIPAEGFVVVAAAPANYPGALGPWSGSLPDSGGTLRLVKRSGGVVLDLEYDDDFPWPVAADAGGHSLHLSRPSLGESNPKAWSQSADVAGSPFTDELPVGSALEHVFINEVLANGTTDFIELYNRSFAEIDVSGCILTDDATLDRFVIPAGTTIAAGGFLSFDSSTLGFGLSAAGEMVLLKNPTATRVIDALKFGGQAPGTAFGRQPDGNPNLIGELSTPTPGTTNAPPLIRDIVINEIMFHPLHEDGSEYVEIFNAGASAVDISGWAFTEGIDFSFPAGTSVAPNGFVVVAKDRAQLLADHPGLAGSIVFGDYGGSLSDRGERLALSQPIALGGGVSFAEVDAVTYADGDRWGRLADGGGSSLELTDAGADNRHAANWAGSDETAKAPWTVIEHTGLLEHGKPGPEETPKSLQLFLLGEGEALVDDVEVEPSGGSNRVTNSTFANSAGWFFQGTHEFSTVENGSLHVRATRRGDIASNRIRTTLSSPLTIGEEGTIRARARWLGGSPYLLLRLFGNHLEVPTVLDVPRDLGTPGATNSASRSNSPPVIADLQHSPLLPAAGEAVRVTTRATDPDGVASLTLSYRIDPSSSTSSLPMLDDGTAGDLVADDGVYSALIPGQASDELVAFRVTATDSAAASSQSPINEALIRWGEGDYAGGFSTYRIWMTAATRSEWIAREEMSNRPLPVTFIYNDTRAIYDAGSQFSGSAFSSPNYDAPDGRICGYDLFFPRDEMVLGDDRMILDFPVRDPTLQREQLMYWFLDQFGLPNNYRRWVNVFVNGIGQRQRADWGTNTNSIYTDIQQPNSDTVREWFPNETGGTLVKGSYWLEFDDNDGRLRTTPRQPSLEVFNSAAGGLHLPRYRWNWRLRAVDGSPNDYSQIFKLVDALSAPGDAIIPAVHANVDIDNWMRTFVVNDCAANWDSFGNPGSKNSFHYRPPGGRWQIMSWDLDVGLGVVNNPTNASLFSLSDPSVGRIYNTPELKRHYWQALREAVDSFFQVSAVTQVLDTKLAALQAAGVPFTSPYSPSGEQNMAIPDWVDARRDYLLAQLATVEQPFDITTNGGASFSTVNAPVVIEGTAPTSVHNLSVNGSSLPFEWTSENTWRIEIALAPGAHSLLITGTDRAGIPVSGATDNITVTATSGADNPLGNLVINEIMYAPSISGGEFLELHNRSTTTAFDLGGWRLNGLGLTFPAGTVIAPSEFMVLAKNRSQFGMAYGWSVPVTLTYPGSLDNSGETISLLQEDGSLIDRVSYSPELPWPIAAAGDDVSLQLTHPSRDNNRSANWIATGADNSPPETLVSMTANWSYNQNGFVATDWNQPSFDDSAWPTGDALLYVESAALPAPKNTPLGLGPTTYYFRHTFNHNGAPGSSLALSTIFDDGAVVYLNGAEIYRVRLPAGAINSGTFASPSVDNASIEGPITVPAPSLISGQNVIAVEIHQSVSNSSDVVMGLELAETASITLSATPGAPNSIPGAPSAEPAQLWLNEVRPTNLGSITDNAGDADPWLELFNAGSAATSLDAWFLSDDPNQLDKWSFPAGTSLANGEFRVAWLDGEVGENSSTDLHTNFAAGSGVVLLSHRSAGAAAPTLVDALTYSGVPAAQSFGRFPDADPSSLQAFVTETPGAPNDASVPVPPITINEWMASNNSTLADPADGDFDDWFELFNAGATNIDLSGFTLTDNLEDPAKFIIPSGVSMASGGFLLVWADDETAQNALGGLHVNFKLGAGGDTIALFTPDGTLVDSVTFTAQSADQSEGRWPDGASGGEFYSQVTVTPGGFNNLSPATPFQTSLPRLLQNADQLSIQFETDFGRYYIVQQSGDLSAASWQDLSSAIPGSGQTIAIELPEIEGRGKFYRILILETP